MGKLAFFSCAGLVIGVWNAYFWSVEELNNGEVVFSTPDRASFNLQFLIGYICFMGGHILMVRREWQPPRFAKLIFCLLAAMLSFAFLAGMFIAYFPLSLVLPASVLGCLFILRCLPNDGFQQKRQWHITAPLGINSLAASLALPVSALMSFHGMVEHQLQFEANVWFALGGTLVGTALLVSAALKAFRHHST